MPTTHRLLIYIAIVIAAVLATMGIMLAEIA